MGGKVFELACLGVSQIGQSVDSSIGKPDARANDRRHSCHKNRILAVPARIAMFSSTLNFGIMLCCVILVFPNRDI